MEWSTHIAADPAVLGGKPVVRGTRLGVEFVLGLLASGWTAEQVMASYPQLTAESLRAVFAFAAEVLREEAIGALPPSAA
jgi:uncharacterized protein (DUF433 family)